MPTKRKSKPKQDFTWKTRLGIEVQEAAHRAFTMMVARPDVRLYLWYREAIPGEHWGELLVADEQPTIDAKKAIDAPLPRNVTVQQLEGLFRHQAGNVPIIGGENFLHARPRRVDQPIDPT